MAVPPRATPLTDVDLLIPDGDVKGEQLRQVFRRLFSQLNPFFESVTSLGSGVTLTQNDHADMVIATFAHGVPSPIRLQRLSVAKSALVRSCDGGMPLGVPVVTMQPQAYPGAPATALVTLYFDNPSATGVKALIELREEGLSPLNPPTLGNTVKVRVQKDAVDVGTRNKLNLIQGANTTLTVADNAPNDRVDVTVGGIAGLEFLGSLSLGSAAATTGALAIAARGFLVILARVTSYSGGGDIASLRFNADAGANYWSRYINSVAGGAVLTNNQNVSQALARLFALTTTLGRSAKVCVTNKLSAPKVGVVSGLTSTGAAGTAGLIEFGGFEWVNTAAQITSVEMLTAAGATMGAGSGFAVFGKNIGNE